MDKIESLMGLADSIGFDAIDSEIEVWIESGAFDYQVIERANVLVEKVGDLAYNSTNGNLRQEFHRKNHPDGTYGWEFCARCLNQ